MTSHAPRSPNRHRDSGYWVEAPRTTDAIGFVLRDTYVGDQNLPDDMRALLGQLTEHPAPSGRQRHR